MANRLKNEVTITLGGHRFKLRPTFQAIAEIEDAFDLPYTKIALTKIATGDVRLPELRDIIVIATRAAEDPQPEQVVEDAIAAAGVTTTLESLWAFFEKTFRGGPTGTDHEKKV